MTRRDIVVVGGSAGSGPPLRTLIAGLPKDFDGSVFITTHLPAHHHSYLPDLLGSAAPLRIEVAVDSRPIEPGCAYVAAPDRHLLLIDGVMRLGAGPREHMVRPAIDPMFRSAALAYGPRVVGVILSGLMNDGASGLAAIKACGGAALVQHPRDAAEGDMPRAALEATDVDEIGRADDLPHLLARIVSQPAGPALTPPDSLAFEIEVAAGSRLSADLLKSYADPAPLTCPDCGGVLSQMRDAQPLRFRCQIGHAHTAEELILHNERVEDAVRLAMRIMEERVELVGRMARDARQTGRTAIAELYEGRAEEYRGYAETLRRAATSTLRGARPPEREGG